MIRREALAEASFSGRTNGARGSPLWEDTVLIPVPERAIREIVDRAPDLETDLDIHGFHPEGKCLFLKIDIPTRERKEKIVPGHHFLLSQEIEKRRDQDHEA